MKPWEKYAQTDDGPWAKYASVEPPQPAKPAAPEMPWQLSALRDAAGGAIRGAGSIGATLLAPIDIASDALAGKGLSLEANRQRRDAMTEALKGIGFDTDSLAFGAGKLGGEIAGTAGVGGTAANVLTRIPGLAAKAPAVIDAIRTAGMSAGGATGKAALGARTVGGGVTGMGQVALVDPESAITGGVVGAALPGGLKAAGALGNVIGNVLRGPVATPDLVHAAERALQAGYVIPPTQVRPSLVNRVLEGTAGKITTAQNASARNAKATNRLAAEAMGLPVDQRITVDALDQVRRTAGQAYEAVKQSGTITPGPSYAKALDAIEKPFLVAAQGFPDAPPSPVLGLVKSLRSPQFDAAAAVEKVKALRTQADDAFRTGNTDIGRAAKKAAAALEDVMEQHLAEIGDTQALNAMREARQLIAKSYSVQSAMNATTGAVDARKLASQLNKGKPLFGGLRDAAEFGGRFPKAAQPIEGMGSLPQISPLDAYGSGGASILAGVVTGGNPLSLLPLAIPAARVGARAAALSGPVQSGLARAPANALSANPALTEMLYRSAPLLVGGR